MYTDNNDGYIFDNRTNIYSSPPSGPRWFEPSGPLEDYEDSPDMIKKIMKYGCPTNEGANFPWLSWMRTEFFSNRWIIRQSPAYGNAVKLMEIRTPSDKVLVTEPDSASWSLDGFDESHYYEHSTINLGDHHSGGINVLWADFHVAWKETREFYDFSSTPSYIDVSLLYPYD